MGKSRWKKTIHMMRFWVDQKTKCGIKTNSGFLASKDLHLVTCKNCLRVLDNP